MLKCTTGTITTTRRLIIGLISRIRKKAARAEKARLRDREMAALRKYMDWYGTLPIEEDQVVIEARNGRTIDGNCFYIAKELVTDPAYEHLKIHIVAFDSDAENEIRTKISGFAGDRIETVILESPEYYRLMASAKYLINDSAIRNFYIKKEGQLYLNVWHGTPLKTMGKRVYHEPHSVGSVQKNFVIADYLLYPSSYMMDHMIEDYMISDISTAHIAMGGYPRNTVFFDREARRWLRGEMSLDGKKVYAYMPTYRPDVMDDPTGSILRSMDQRLQDDEILYVNIHPLAAQGIDLDSFRSVRPFPAEYETYAVLNMCDALITDYSSVFYDFALTGRKILLYTYDEEEYFKTRGLYEPLSSLPFANLKDLDEVFEALRDESAVDYSSFTDRYGPFEGPRATSDLCRMFFLDEDTMDIHMMPSNGLDNVLVHNGELDSTERREALLKALRGLDPGEANYYLFFNRRNLTDDPGFLHRLPEGIRFFGRTGKTVFSAEQEDVQRQYKEGKIDFDAYWEALRPAYAIEKRRYLGDAPVSKVIQLPLAKDIGPDSTEMELEMSAYL